MGHQEEGIEDQIITTNANDSDTNTLVPSHSEQVNDFFKHLCEIQVKNSVKLNHLEAFLFNDDVFTICRWWLAEQNYHLKAT